MPILNLFEVKPENIYGIASTDPMKEEKINFRIESDLYVASIKKDGNYARFVKQDMISKIQSRGISTVTDTYGEFHEKVPDITQYLKTVTPDNSLIIGELYREDLDDKGVGSILRCLPPKAIARQKDKPLHFYIHDVWYYNNENFMICSKAERIKKLKKIKEEWEQSIFGIIDEIDFAEYVDGVDNIKELLAGARADDEEGIVLTLRDSIVNPGAKTAWKTLKIKKELENDADVFLTGDFKEGEKLYTGKQIENWEYWENEKTGQKLFGQLYKDYIDGATIRPITKNFYKGWPGSLQMAVIDKTGKQIIVGYMSGLSEEIKEDFIRNRNAYIDKCCKITAMSVTEDFKFRHGKFRNFREDINKNDCTFEKIFGEKGE